MAILTFKADDVLRVVEHSLKNKQAAIADWSTANEKNGWTPKTSVPTEKHVVLVHDQGVYLMSNGTPRDTVKRRSQNGKHMLDSSFCAYADGCDPNVGTFDDWWETSRSIVGGDDFAEYLPWAARMLLMIRKGAKTIRIQLTSTKLELMV